MRAKALLSVAAAVLLAGCGGSAAHTSKIQPANALTSFASDQTAIQGHLVSAHTTGTLEASIPFDPTRDGFSFENYAFIAGTQIDQHVMRELFGDGVCADAPSDSCTLTPAAQQWVQQAIDSTFGGHCFGFSVTALRFFTHRLDPAAFGGSTPFSLPLSAALENDLAYGFVMQQLDSVRRATFTGAPSQIIAFLEKAFKNPSAEVYTLGFYNGSSSNPEGHAVTPIGVENLGGGKYNILIYDNNKPGTTQAVSVDTNAETWSYELAINPTDPSTLWGGQGTTNPMFVVPLSPGLGVQPCPFCGAAGRSRAGVVRISLGGDPDVHGHLLIVSGGRRLGYVNGRFVNEINGARVIRPLLNEIWKAHPEPIYEVPAGTKLSITLQGAGASGHDAAAVHVTGPGFGATVENLLPGPTSSDQITVAPGGSAVALALLGSAQNGTPTVQLARDHGRTGSVLVVTPKALAAGTQLNLRLAPSISRLSVTTSGATQPVPVAVTLRAVGPAGSRIVQNHNVGLTPGMPATFSLRLAAAG